MRPRKDAAPRDIYTIGLVADTHDVDDPVGVIEELARHAGEYNVHLGDIGGSRTVMHVVRDFKRHLGDIGHLPAGQQRQYHDAIQRGASPLRAYVETRLGDDGLALRVAETSGAYRAILARMARLPNPILLRGNVDGMQLQAPHIQACFAESPLQLMTRPRLIDLDWLGLLLWPSWRHMNAAEEGELADTVVALSAAAAGKTHVVVLAHEHFFKGPSAGAYTARVARAGLQQLTVPRFDPNPTWSHLMQLFRRLPFTIRSYYVFGHVHDAAEVMVAGAPALRNPAGPGLRYRLYGLGWRGERGGLTNGARRGLTMLPVAVNEVALLGVRRGRDDISWQVVRYERTARQGPG